MTPTQPKDTSVIPEGMYCYSRRHKNEERCPYWSMDETHEYQDNGYCSYMEMGDWESEYLTLLWDQVKECGINDDITAWW